MKKAIITVLAILSIIILISVSGCKYCLSVGFQISGTLKFKYDGSSYYIDCDRAVHNPKYSPGEYNYEYYTVITDENGSSREAFAHNIGSGLFVVHYYTSELTDKERESPFFDESAKWAYEYDVCAVSGYINEIFGKYYLNVPETNQTIEILCDL